MRRLLLPRGALYMSMKIKKTNSSCSCQINFRARLSEACIMIEDNIGKDTSLDILRDRFYWLRMNVELEYCERCIKHHLWCSNDHFIKYTVAVYRL